MKNPDAEKSIFLNLWELIRSFYLKIQNNPLVCFAVTNKVTHPFLRKTWRFMEKQRRSSFDFKFVKEILVNDKDKFLIVLEGKNQNSVDFDLYKEKGWEDTTFKTIKKHCDKRKQFLDLGANIGYISLYASFFFKEIYSFEPIPELYSQFKESLSINKIKNVHVFNLAVSDKKGKAKFNRDKIDLARSSLVDYDNSDYESIQVNTVKLDGFKKIDKVGMIKIDVEGHERSALKGAEKIIRKHRPFIVMEFYVEKLEKVDKNEPLNLLKYVKKLGYSIVAVEEDGTQEKIDDLNKYLSKLKKEKRGHDVKEIGARNLFLKPENG